MEFSQTIGETPSNTIKEGDEVQAYIVKLETKEGYTLLSRKRAEYETAWNLLGRIAKTKEQIEIQVTSNVEGGLVVDYKGIKGFIPASHVLKTAEEKLEGFLNTTLSVVVIQVERKRRKVIFSHKLARIKPDKVDLDKVIDKIEVGEVYSGVVSSIKDFGAFVNIGGAEGLVHISELSWSRVNHPSEMLKVGDNVQVFVLGVDREHNKISLGMKQLQPDPWVNVMERFKIGQVVKGKITRLVSFGAFIQLEKDVEGLIHISELSYDHIEKAEEAVKPGQEVTAKIIKLLPDEQKIGLTLKGIDQNSAVAEIASVEEPTV
jgi:ribosomal protein S1